MAFPVRTIQGAPSFDAFPVAKVIDYPLEERDYRPYAQNCICVNDDSLTLRMWAFEVTPMPSSEVRGVFYLFPNHPQRALHVWARVMPDSQELSCGASLVEGGGETPLPPNSYGIRPFNGEDLQGVYWGITATLSLPKLEQAGGGELSLAVGRSFYGNFFKTCEDARFTHKGSFYPADWQQPYHRPSTGEFVVVAY